MARRTKTIAAVELDWKTRGELLDWYCTYWPEYVPDVACAMKLVHEVVLETTTVVNAVLVCTVVEVETVVEVAPVVSKVVGIRLVETTVTDTTTLLVAVTVLVGV